MTKKKREKKAELVFDDNYFRYMTCWYENGALKEEGKYKDGFPRWETWKIWPESRWDPIDAGYVAFAIAYTATTIFNWLTK